MTTRRLLALLLVVMAVAVTVARARLTGPAAPAEPAGRTYTVVGVVTAPPGDGRVTVAHEDIADYMPAMTMPFALDAGAPAPAVTAGDRVRFTLHVAGDRVWADGFEVTGRDASVADAARDAHAAANRRIREGDVVPDVALRTQADTPFTAADLRGHRTALTFIFTRCPVPDFCPLMVKRFQQLQRAMTSDPALASARLLAVSLDPTFDTPAVLAAYAKAMGADPARWTFVTGTPDEVSRLTRAFAVHVERNGVLLDHTLATAVIDADGRVLEIWRGNGWKAEEIAAVLRNGSTE